MNDFLPLANGAEEFIWNATFSADSHIKMWDDDTAGVMYDARTGDTHFLDPVAMELLRLLSISPRSVKEMSEAIVSDMLSVSDDLAGYAEASAGQVVDTLQRLRDCGLVGIRRS